MRYETARQILAEAIEQLDEGRKSWHQRSASLIGRMGGSPEEVRQGITGKRTPAAKSGRALLNKAQKAAEKKMQRDPDYPYGKAESRRMSKYMSESELDEGTRRTARLSAAVAKAQKKGEKVGPRSPLAKAASKARAKYMRSEDKRELNPGAIENRMKWQAKYPGPSQPRGFGSYGF